MYVCCRTVFQERNVLILTITHSCNLRCKVCPLSKKYQVITLETAKRAVNLFLSTPSSPNHNNYLIRFFGGEPLLEFKLLKKLIPHSINNARNNDKKITFHLTTNGLLLNEAVLDYFKRFKDFELVVSSRFFLKIKNKRIFRTLFILPNLCLNFFIDPNTINEFPRSFFHFLKLGFKNFNFLPAYFTVWNTEDLKKMEKGLRIISVFLNKFGHKLDIHIKNIYNISSEPLFNQNLTIDCNGDVYPNNLVFFKKFSYLKGRFKLGNVHKVSDFSKLLGKSEFINYKEVIRRDFSDDILESTYKVDSILSQFVGDLLL